MDPVVDHHAVYRISAGLEFPWDYQRALELALFKTYCVPSVSALLDATGEFANRPQRRYDDTALLMAELAEHGYDSERGKAALRVVNRMHGRYAIDNADMLYVLTTFIYDPIDWIDAYGWRPLSEAERLAAFHFYRAVGVRMGIKDIPEDTSAFRRFKDDYEREHFVFSETNQRVGQHTRELLVSWYPWLPKPLTRLAVHGLLTDRMLTAFGFPTPPRWLRRLEPAALRARGRLVRLLPPREVSRLANDAGNRTYPGYPDGYHPSDLGAPEPHPALDPHWKAR
ncbi:oxygenase MpaB family protein [Actinokineospora sp. G85]|uniref:oxygenase MpaB family protein n=1 Tax=Actinokineospora sp. G85 TaxID=3406626 RepID=UPI003C74317C